MQKQILSPVPFSNVSLLLAGGCFGLLVSPLGEPTLGITGGKTTSPQTRSSFQATAVCVAPFSADDPSSVFWPVYDAPDR